MKKNKRDFDRPVSLGGRPVPRRPAHLRLDAEQVVAMVESMPVEQRELHTQYVDDARDSQTMLEWSNEHLERIAVEEAIAGREDVAYWGALRELGLAPGRAPDGINRVGGRALPIDTGVENPPPNGEPKATDVSKTVPVPNDDLASGRTLPALLVLLIPLVAMVLSAGVVAAVVGLGLPVWHLVAGLAAVPAVSALLRAVVGPHGPGGERRSRWSRKGR